MFGIAHYGTFVVSFILLLILPGPGNFALITSTGKGGVKGGLAAIAGVIIGDQILMWLALAGVAALLKTYPATFHGVQILGGLYLGYLGLRLMLAKAGEASVVNIAPFHYLRQTLFITLCNPKAVLFYLAFLPLFIDPSEHRGVATFTALALTVSSLTFLYGVIVIGLIRFFAERIRSNQALTLFFQRIAGAFLIGFGVKLLIAR
ncbi:LysE family transporter [Pseudomonas sp. DC3000-4b1]|uniref:LysE family transporter n=1 Tax=unclassified Pseudomonas TaxID=196821 RepID=UPI003CEDC0B2